MAAFVVFQMNTLFKKETFVTRAFKRDRCYDFLGF